MSKIFEYIAETAKSIVFKSDDELNPKNHKFDSMKFSIFLFIIFASTFNVYAIKYIARQAAIIYELQKTKLKQDIIFMCIDKNLKEQTDRAVLNVQHEGEFSMNVKKCMTPPSEEKNKH